MHIQGPIILKVCPIINISALHFRVIYVFILEYFISVFENLGSNFWDLISLEIREYIYLFHSNDYYFQEMLFPKNGISVYGNLFSKQGWIFFAKNKSC